MRGPADRNRLDEVLRLEPLALARADHQAEVRQRQQDDAVQEDDASVTQVGPVERGADGLGREQTDRAAEQRAEHVRDGDVLEPQLEGDDQQPEDDAENGVENGIAEQRLKLKRGIADRRDEEHTREHEPRHDGLQGQLRSTPGMNE